MACSTLPLLLFVFRDLCEYLSSVSSDMSLLLRVHWALSVGREEDAHQAASFRRWKAIYVQSMVIPTVLQSRKSGGVYWMTLLRNYITKHIYKISFLGEVFLAVVKPQGCTRVISYVLHSLECLLSLWMYGKAEACTLGYSSRLYKQAFHCFIIHLFIYFTGKQELCFSQLCVIPWGWRPAKHCLSDCYSLGNWRMSPTWPPRNQGNQVSSVWTGCARGSS